MDCNISSVFFVCEHMEHPIINTNTCSFLVFLQGKKIQFLKNRWGNGDDWMRPRAQSINQSFYGYSKSKDLIFGLSEVDPLITYRFGITSMNVKPRNLVIQRKMKHSNETRVSSMKGSFPCCETAAKTSGSSATSSLPSLLISSAPPANSHGHPPPISALTGGLLTLPPSLLPLPSVLTTGARDLDGLWETTPESLLAVPALHCRALSSPENSLLRSPRNSGLATWGLLKGEWGSLTLPANGCSCFVSQGSALVTSLLSLMSPKVVVSMDRPPLAALYISQYSEIVSAASSSLLNRILVSGTSSSSRSLSVLPACLISVEFLLSRGISSSSGGGGSAAWGFGRWAFRDGGRRWGLTGARRLWSRSPVSLLAQQPICSRTERFRNVKEEGGNGHERNYVGKAEQDPALHALSFRCKVGPISYS